jgi:hypothetical protein
VELKKNRRPHLSEILGKGKACNVEILDEHGNYVDEIHSVLAKRFSAAVAFRGILHSGIPVVWSRWLD